MSWTKMWLLTAIQKTQPSTDAATGMPSQRKPMADRADRSPDEHAHPSQADEGVSDDAGLDLRRPKRIGDRSAVWSEMAPRIRFDRDRVWLIPRLAQRLEEQVDGGLRGCGVDRGPDVVGVCSDADSRGGQGS